MEDDRHQALTGSFARLAWLLAGALLVCACPTPGSDVPQRSPKPAPPPRQVLAWLIGGTQSRQSLQQNLAACTIISPAYYKVEVTPAASGKPATTKLVDWDPGNPVDRSATRALTTGKPLLPLVACLDSCAAQLSPLLADPAARAVHIQAILDGSAADQMDGLFIDYEGLTCPASVFSQFVDELAALLHAKGRRLGVAITEPCGISPACTRSSYPFAIGALVRTVDHLAVMEYDFAVDGSDAVAPRDWVARGMQRIGRDAAASLHKVFVGVPFYGRLSAGLAADTGVLWSDIKERKIHGSPFVLLEKTFSEEKLSQVGKIAFGKERKPGLLHFEDRQTLAARLKLIGDSGFSSIAIWRLGGEDPGMWDVIRRWLGRSTQSR